MEEQLRLLKRVILSFTIVVILIDVSRIQNLDNTIKLILGGLTIIGIVILVFSSIPLLFRDF